MNKDLECRVGFATVVALRREVKDYIKAHVEDHKYVGDVKYLMDYSSLSDYIRQHKEEYGEDETN